MFFLCVFVCQVVLHVRDRLFGRSHYCRDLCEGRRRVLADHAGELARMADRIIPQLQAGTATAARTHIELRRSRMDGIRHQEAIGCRCCCSRGEEVIHRLWLPSHPCYPHVLRILGEFCELISSSSLTARWLFITHCTKQGDRTVDIKIIHIVTNFDATSNQESHHRARERPIFTYAQNLMGILLELLYCTFMHVRLD